MGNEEVRSASHVPGADEYIRLLSASNPLREPVMRAAIQALQLPWGSRGLDAGCGIGLQVLLLAEAVGPAGHVTGLDIAPEFLAYAEAVVEQAGLLERVSFRTGDINQLPYDEDALDWIWSVDCAGYRAKDPLSLLKELTRVVKPGGIVAILVWSSQMLLPGYPLLEARLNVTSGGIAPFTVGMKPEHHHLRALGWFREAGFSEPKAETLVGSVHAPLNDNLRTALADLFQMRWGGVEAEVSPEVWAQ